MILIHILLASPAVRSPRPNSVKLRVGQVVRHQIYGYHGVIIGWDEVARAPDRWLNEHHQGHPVMEFRFSDSIYSINWSIFYFFQEYRKQPNYSVLLDTRDRQAHKTYIPQEHLEVVVHKKVRHTRSRSIIIKIIRF